MKRIFPLLIIITFFFSCKLKNQVDNPKTDGIYSLPQAQYLSYSNLTDSSVTIHCQLISDGNDPNAIYGVTIKALDDYANYVNPEQTLEGADCTFFNLNPGTKYTVNVFAKNEYGTYIEDIPGWYFQTLGPNIRITNMYPLEHDARFFIQVHLEDGGLSEWGYCYATHPHPTIKDIKVRLGDATTTLSRGCDIGGLEIERTYYIRGYVKGSGRIYYGAVCDFDTKKWKPSFEAGIPVDLGLSVLWADRNLEAQSKSGCGKRFAWGDLAPKWISCVDNNRLYSYEKDGYYKYFTEGENLELEDDAAHNSWGGNWRMPTLVEVEELFSKCYVEFGVCDRIQGIMITGNNNSIFIPSYRAGDGPQDITDYYWTATLKDINQAYTFRAKYESQYRGPAKREQRLLIRPVCNKK